MRSSLQGLVLLALWVLSFVLMSYWLGVSKTFDWQQGLGSTSLLLAGLAAGVGWKNSLVGQLAWDGQDWHWASTGYQSGMTSDTVSVVFDFQSLLLLRVENPVHATRWLWVEKGTLPGRWLDLRRAVYSPHRASKMALTPA